MHFLSLLKNIEGWSEFQCEFVNLEKAYDRVLREELWHYLKVPRVRDERERSAGSMPGASKTS